MCARHREAGSWQPAWCRRERKWRRREAGGKSREHRVPGAKPAQRGPWRWTAGQGRAARGVRGGWTSPGCSPHGQPSGAACGCDGWTNSANKASRTVAPRAGSAGCPPPRKTQPPPTALSPSLVHLDASPGANAAEDPGWTSGLPSYQRPAEHARRRSTRPARAPRPRITSSPLTHSKPDTRAQHLAGLPG